MDGIQSWSSFDKQQQRKNEDVGSGLISGPAAETTIGRGIDALYVSSSSPDIAPAAATLLRHSGLTAPKISNGSSLSEQQEGDSQQRKEDEEEEFRLRFHWMRPHPSLAFALEGELTAGTTGAETDDSEDDGVKVKSEATEQQPVHGNALKEHSNPAIEASKLMEAYRFAQMNKQIMDETTNTNTEGNGSDGDDREETESEPNSANLQSNEASRINLDLPLELPKLRINLASLIEPPLMSSWLPGEDTCMSDDSEDEIDD